MGWFGKQKEMFILDAKSNRAEERERRETERTAALRARAQAAEKDIERMREQDKYKQKIRDARAEQFKHSVPGKVVKTAGTVFNAFWDVGERMATNVSQARKPVKRSKKRRKQKYNHGRKPEILRNPNYLEDAFNW